MKDDITIRRESTEPLEDIYKTAAEELKDMLSDSDPEFSINYDETPHKGEEALSPEFDNEPERQPAGMFGLSRMLIIGLAGVGILAIASAAFIFRPEPHLEDSISIQRTEPPVTVKIPAAVEKGTEIAEHPPTDRIDSSAGEKITQPIEKQSLPDTADKTSTSTKPADNTGDEVERSTKGAQILPGSTQTKQYAVQVAAFKTSDKAEQLVETFTLKGFDAHWSRVVLGNGEIWYRTFIGHFSDMDKARAFKERLCADGLGEACFVRELSPG